MCQIGRFFVNDYNDKIAAGEVAVLDSPFRVPWLELCVSNIDSLVHMFYTKFP